MPKASIPKGYNFVMEHVAHDDEQCLLWPFKVAQSGYAQFQYCGVLYTAHRFMCIQAHGEPPTPKHEAAHLCGVRSCVNPKHLKWKTPGENWQDRRIHGTYSFHRDKLNWQTASDIRKLKGIERADITAQRFGITESNVRKVQSGQIWKEERDPRLGATLFPSP